jgi:hypothetical protein
MNPSFEHLRTWTAPADAYRLELYTTYQIDEYGKEILAYQFFHNDVVVFEGADFHCPQWTPIDGDQTVASLLAFLSLKPGDTDPEYFAGYTPEQMAFALAEGDNLHCYVEDLEGQAHVRRSQ